MAKISRRAVLKAFATGAAGAGLGPRAPTADAQEAPTKGFFHGVGVITEVNQDNGFLTIDHDEIKGYMAAMIMTYNVAPGAMIMTYNVAPGAMSQNLRKGDRIEFDIDASTETIVAIRVIGAPAP